MVRKKILNVLIFFMVITLFVLMLPGLTYAEEGDATVTPPEESTVTPPEETTATDTTFVDDTAPPVEEPVIEPEVPVVEVEVNATLEETTALDTVINTIIDTIVTTDKDDYTPGEIVVVRGSGWLAGETVRLNFDEIPYNPPVTYSVTADAEGNIYDTQYVIDDRHVGSTITLTATGQTSGFTAKTVFTDGSKVGSVSVGSQSPSSVTAGSSATYTITVNRGTGGGSTGAFTADLSITTALPTGASGSFSPNPVSFTPTDTSKTCTLTITTSSTTPEGSTNFTVKAITSTNDWATGDGNLSVQAAAGDTTAPTGSITINSDATYTNSTSVTLNLSATDAVGVTGYKVADGTDASAATITAVTSTTSYNDDVPWTLPTGDGTKTVAVMYCDEAGNWSGNYTDDITLDETPPDITINIPASGANYTLNQIVNADWTATDATSGIKSATGTVTSGSPIDTSSIGPKTFQVDAEDNAGNEATVEVTYYVKYNYIGVLQPINDDGSGPKSIFKLGSTIPVKFQLMDYNGSFVTDAVVRIVVARYSGTPPDAGEYETAVSTSAATTGNLFRYDSLANQYIFNLATKTLLKGEYQIRLDAYNGDVFAYTLDEVVIGLK